MRTIRAIYAFVFLSASLAIFPLADATAGGFFVRQQSTSAQASAFAGASARGSDPSHMFYNPATIVDNPGSNLTIDARVFFPDAKISVDSATSLLGNDVTSRGNSGSMADPAIAPGMFATMALSERLFFGVSVAAPFAVVIESDPVWAGQFQLVRTEMTTYNVNPVLAWELLPGITISGGIQVQHYNLDLRKTEILPLAPAVFAESLGFLEGEDTSVGVTGGLLFKIAQGFRVGLGYRSQVKHKFSGSAGVRLSSVPDDTAFFTIKTPQVATLGVEKRLTKRVTFLGEVQWTDWSVFKGFKIDFGSGRPTEIRPQDWRDTWFVAGGARVEIGDRTDLTAGLSYDQGISKGSGNTLSPDGNRTGISLGVTHRISERLTARLSYMHLFLDDSPIDVQNESGTLAANFTSDLDVVGFSLTFKR